MSPWLEFQLARSRHASLLREAEVDRLLRESGLEEPSLRARLGARLLAWAVTAHRRLHEADPGAQHANGHAKA